MPRPVVVVFTRHDTINFERNNNADVNITTCHERVYDFGRLSNALDWGSYMG
jgi:hypothetical protein